MRGIAFAVIAGMCAGLAGCMTRDPYVATPATTAAGNWKIERQVDRITGVPVPSAMVFTTNASNSFADYARTASMQLTCFEGKPLVRFAFEFKVGSNNNSTLGYRFDDRPGRDNVAAHFLHEYRTVVIEDRAEVARFIGDMTGANTLVIRIRSLAAGRTTADFKLDGASAAVEAAFTGCPLTPPAAENRRAGARS